MRTDMVVVATPGFGHGAGFLTAREPLEGEAVEDRCCVSLPRDRGHLLVGKSTLLLRSLACPREPFSLGISGPKSPGRPIVQIFKSVCSACCVLACCVSLAQAQVSSPEARPSVDWFDLPLPQDASKCGDVVVGFPR